MSAPNFLKKNEVARRLQASEKTVDRRIRSGKLKAFKEGGRVCVLLSDFENYLKQISEGASSR